MVIDVITYNGEQELFELRYNILKDYVDEFIVVEFDKTFSGKPKNLKFKLLFPKVKYCFIPESQWSKYEDLAKSSPNTEYGKGAKHWITEFAQKESIKDCLTHLNDDDIVIISDADEIWKPEAIDLGSRKLKLKTYTYWLNNYSNEQFWGTIVTEGWVLKDPNTVLNHLRTNLRKTTQDFGWHFTSLAPYLKDKLIASYTQESYATEAIMSNLEANIANNRDFLGRPFEYKEDESEWPVFLKKHRNDYKHLLKPIDTSIAGKST